MNLNKVVFKFVSVSFSILVTLLVVVGLVKLGTFCYDFGYRVFTEVPVDAAPGKDVTVQVTGDMSEHDIGIMLAEMGLVDDGNLFFVQLKLSAYSQKLRAGTYVLNTSMTPREMMAAMVAEPEEDTEGDEDAEDMGQAEDEGIEPETETGTETQAGEET